MEIKHQPQSQGGEFTAHNHGHPAGELQYSLSDGHNMVILHTEVYPEMEGKGIGKRLVEHALRYAEENGFNIRAMCPFAKKVMERMKGQAG